MTPNAVPLGQSRSQEKPEVAEGDCAAWVPCAETQGVKPAFACPSGSPQTAVTSVESCWNCPCPCSLFQPLCFQEFLRQYPSTHAYWFICTRVSPAWYLSHLGPGASLPWVGVPRPSHLWCQEQPTPIMTSKDACSIAKHPRRGAAVFGGEELVSLDVHV